MCQRARACTHAPTRAHPQPLDAVVSSEPPRPPTQYGVRCAENATVSQAVAAASGLCGVTRDRFILAEVKSGEILRASLARVRVRDLRPRAMLVAYEVPYGAKTYVPVSAGDGEGRAIARSHAHPHVPPHTHACRSSTAW